ncbi:DUF3883 domain-containing protein [Companilactobacillus ginsenosidimutans]|uniref:DUF3883 domain-containing protein n=1 Tax=Companilactobacillus ginsenosidimutans TaxID=1007676 RepID=UPI0006601FCF|nr:DUF3883 domain-containing protein [Companilactobacillus ginsenosidimutans]
MKVYLVSQNQTWKIESKGEFLWSPKRAKNGSKNAGYEAMSRIKKGDIVFNVHDRLVYSISEALSDAYSFNKSDLNNFDVNDNWDPDGWRVDLKMHEVNFSIKEHLEYFKKNNGSAFTNNGKLNQKYLSELNPEQVEYFSEHSLEIQRLILKISMNPVYENIESRIDSTDFNLENKNYAEFKSSNKRENTSESVIRDTSRVDYETIYFQNQLVGSSGEEVVLDYLVKKYPEANVEGVSQNLDSENGRDDLGYDISVIFPNGFRYLIDVKTSTSGSGRFFVSENERQVAEKCLENNNHDYFFYHVSEFDKNLKRGKLSVVKINDIMLKPISYQASCK